MTDSPDGPAPRAPSPMRRILRSLPVVCLFLAGHLSGTAPLAAQDDDAPPPVLDSPPSVLLKGVAFPLAILGPDRMGPDVPFRVTDARGRVVASGTVPPFESRIVEDLVVEAGDALPLTVAVGAVEDVLDPTLVNGWFSLAPPLLAILLALIFREVITALVAGVWLGCLAVAGFDPIQATWRLMDTFIVPAVADADHASIIVFSMLLGGMVGLVSRNGGTMGIVEALAPLASSPRRGKLATWAAGLAIFFDDYANTLIVGNTMRPITDRLKISREKLAYLVDSTAAPVAALVPVSTWVGYEISLIADGVDIAQAQNPGNAALMADLASTSPFLIFIHTIPYLFYPLLALAFVFLTSAMDRDWGPMAAAERRAATGGGLHRPGAQLAMDTSGGEMDAKDGVPHRWWNAALPVLTVVIVVLAGLYATGVAETGPGASLMDVFGAADPFATLLWGSL
ncbi:MAG: Na+/H+ antiporter NhaC family protein, partial [Longimicrobiales bacterium]